MNAAPSLLMLRNSDHVNLAQERFIWVADAAGV